jgi:hypothetical protein
MLTKFLIATTVQHFLDSVCKFLVCSILIQGGFTVPITPTEREILSSLPPEAQKGFTEFVGILDSGEGEGLGKRRLSNHPSSDSEPRPEDFTLPRYGSGALQETTAALANGFIP